MDGVDSPFLTRISGSTTTRKKGEFTESRGGKGTPSLVGWTLQGNAYQLAFVELDGKGDATVRSMPATRLPKLSQNAASLALCRLVYIGDGLLLSIINNANDFNDNANDYEQVVHWPAMLPVNAGIKQRGSEEDVGIAKAVAYIDSVVISGLVPYFHDFGLHATGWDGDTKRYRFGMSCRYYTDGSTKDKAQESRVPVFFAGNTGDKSLVQTAVPFYPGRNHAGGKVFVIGPGRLQQLVFVTEQKAEDREGNPILYPYFANSSDHGDSWSSATAEFIRPFLYIRPLTPMVPANPAADPPTPEIPEKRAYLDNQHLERMQDNHINVYLGDGKSMLIIPNGFVEKPEGQPVKTCAMAFLGDQGGNYTRVSWPADDWRHGGGGGVLGEPENFATDSYVRLFRLPKDRYSAQFAFGVGCMYVPIKVATVTKFLVTYDFGGSWTIKDFPARPDGVTGGELLDSGTIIEPYLNEDEPGEIIFAYPNYNAGRIDFLKTNGLFGPFEKTAGMVNYKTPLATPGPQLYFQMGEANQHFTYFGGAKKSHIYPAFPGEFDKP